MVVYLDKVFFLNFAVDFLLLLGTNRLTGFPCMYLRCSMAALFGAVYGALCLLPGFFFLGNPVWRLMSLLAMGVTAFGWNRSAWQRCCVFFLLAMALGGIAVQAGREEFSSLVLCALLLWGICTLASGGSSGKQEYQVLKLTLGERSVSMLALLDSGNSLTDPVTGQSVVVISPKIACRLTGLSEQALRKPIETLTQHPIPGLRLIPYRTISGNGMLLGMKIHNAELDGKKRSLMVAFAADGLGNGDVYQALTGGVL